MQDDLNFSWVIENMLAGCAAPMSSDELQYLATQGIEAIVRLAHPETDELVIDVEIVEAEGLEDCHVAVRDHEAPSQNQIRQTIEFIIERLRTGRSVVVSCGAGCGRTGTILACYLVTQGFKAQDALNAVISRRPCSIEIKSIPAQVAAIDEYERWLRGGNERGVNEE